MYTIHAFCVLIINRSVIIYIQIQEKMKKKTIGIILLKVLIHSCFYITYRVINKYYYESNS